ncbi:MAG TPA: TetR/AcrR family transcriptional regulator [Baekduia sp.]|uniref:TetR/AcrR family transcriptional regulator n=1 Tax=Baekduia sp. TaxID=2600305 RepID=UPI002D76BBD5|nr:TetR/AcrR family transcriptional regulator [Baekduia sp.]HET6509675.1 TetR/AcrR family transcriptional regulator [Baekduia sp.]
MTRPSPATRLSRIETQEANRRALLDATREVVAVGGAAIRLEVVAERAGLTTGAIYSIFGSKSDLLVALLADELSRVDEAAPFEADPSLTLAEVIIRYVEAWQAAYAGPSKGTTAFELQVFLSALEDERLLAQLREALDADLQRLVGLLVDRVVDPASSHRTTLAEATAVATAIKAVLTGFGLRRPVTGDTDALARDACVALAGLVG